ncbi:radical SAM protein [Tepidibacter aestuarii]|uniref:radical SAM protein n=1 Tax=Tepidibacter aestuarii TaxID=2925782 RepID=UPI0020C14071|nr:radical SAM protein [Tepidibacter aestuarii]CAH2212422.1 Elp3 domain-containing protein [Tepidibacter aestuarii]
MKLEDKMSRALKIKESNFGKNIIFSYPNKTLAVTTTGNDCSLKCAHCNGHYLKNMTDINEIDEKIKHRNIDSFLISGGCSFDGQVPIINHIKDIEVLKNKGYKINAHLGLMDEHDIKKISGYIDVASFDILLNDETIKNVYKIDKKKQDYIKSYEILKKYTRVVPHICIGIDSGQIKGEYDALEYLETQNPDSITFIVLIPTKGTEFEKIQPPKIEDVIEIICEARMKFPNIHINLGCMRPRGKYRKQLDKMAILSGINNIVMPSKEAIEEAMNIKCNIQKLERCCVL